MNEPSLSIRALLDRGAEQRSNENRVDSVDTEDADDYQAFAGGRIGNRTQWTLVFQFASGAVRGFPYAQFDGLRSENPEAGFIVSFAGVEVEVEGRQLGPLLRAVCEHRAATIVEATRAQGLLRPREEAVVAVIQVRTSAR